jgi:hypothetical protein
MSTWLIPLTAVMGVFPSMEHDQISVGAYGMTQTLEGPLDLSTVDPTQLRGLELRYRDISPAEDIGDALASGYVSLARFGIDDEGRIQVDQLRLETAVLSIKIRRDMGDLFDLAILGGDSEITWKAVDRGNLFLRTFSPTNLTILGFSNTDFDVDAKLKAYASVGTGIGGEVLLRVFEHLGLTAHGGFQARTLNRHQGDAKNQVRHEVMADGELGLGYLAGNFGVLFSGWGELGTQWEVRDADGKSGVDRQVLNWGLRLTTRWSGAAKTAPVDEVEISVDARTW